MGLVMEGWEYVVAKCCRQQLELNVCALLDRHAQFEYSAMNHSSTADSDGVASDLALG